ncbi:MAG: Xaa-Pro peptidase family protein [Bacillota bacterium]
MPVFKERIELIRVKMEEKGLPALLVSHHPNIFYISGFSGSSGWLLLTAKRAVLFTDFRYMQQAGQEAPFCQIVKLDMPPAPSLFQQVRTILKDEGLSSLAVEEAYLTLQEFNKLKENGDGLALLPCSDVVEEIRILKDEGEIERIATAARIADNALLETLPLLKPGISERELAGELEYRLRRAGAAGIAFSTIVASGPRSALPHGVAATRLIGENEFIVIDFGAIWDGYCSDMTRTFVLGEPTLQQERIYRLVCDAREIALQAIKPGEQAVNIDAAVRRFLEEEGYAFAFGHGLGHGVGLEVHERPTLSPRGTDLLQEGMVFTVEPGLYLEGQGGVRVEDLVVLRPQGPQLLSGSGRELPVF